MNADDPLLPPPDGTGWVTPASPGVDPLEHLNARVFDYFNFNALAWPARDNSGHLVTPPPEHILDSLARSHDLANEDEILIRPAANTVAIVIRLPRCDLCGAPEARYDGQLTTERSGTAYFCEDCYSRLGSGSLGASGDVRLITYAEVPREVRAICDEITDRQGRPSLWASSSHLGD